MVILSTRKNKENKEYLVVNQLDLGNNIKMIHESWVITIIFVVVNKYE